MLQIGFIRNENSILIIIYNLVSSKLIKNTSRYLPNAFLIYFGLSRSRLSPLSPP